MIKPCPICNSDPDQYETAYGCNVKCKGENHEVVTWGETPEEAADTWNRTNYGVWSCNDCGAVLKFTPNYCPFCGVEV